MHRSWEFLQKLHLWHPRFGSTATMSPTCTLGLKIKCRMTVKNFSTWKEHVTHLANRRTDLHNAPTWFVSWNETITNITRIFLERDLKCLSCRWVETSDLIIIYTILYIVFFHIYDISSILERNVLKYSQIFGENRKESRKIRCFSNYF